MADFRIMPVFYREAPNMSDENGVFPPGDTTLSEDADLPLLVRIQQKAQSDNIYERQMVVKKILEVFRSGPVTALVDDYAEIMEILSKLADEDETDVRANLIEQIPYIAFQAIKCADRLPIVENIVGDHLLPIVVRNLKTNSKKVRMKVHSVLSDLMQHGFVTKEQVETQVCPAILELSKIDSDVDFIIGAINLMCKVAPFLGQELTETILLPRFSSLCSNQLFYVRKVCVSHIAHFCAVVGEEAYKNVLLPCYIKLCTDESVSVRQACAEIMSVACACPSDARKNILTPVFAKLLQDQNRFVRIAAFEKLGPFISTFADPSITNLTYNNVGELVVITANDIEFRVKTPSLSELSCRKTDIDVLHDIYYDKYDDSAEPKNVTINISYDFSNVNKEDDNVYTSNFYNYLPDSDDFNVKNGADFIFGDSSETNDQVIPLSDEEDKCDNIEESHLEFLDSIYKTNDVNSSSNENFEDNCITNACGDEDIKEIVETVKNAVLSYRNPEQSCGYNELSNTNVICDNSNQCDNVDSEIKKISSHLKNISLVNSCTADFRQESDINNHNKFLNNYGSNADEDNFKYFNSYSYWYISPDLPLDPAVVNDGKMDTSSINFSYDHQYDLNQTFGNDKKIEEKSNSQQQSLQQPEQEIVPSVLIEHFVSMTDPTLAQETYDGIAWDCAYFLPAVALTLGSKNWPLLQSTLEKLAANMQYKVRKTVASSLHELAFIVGPEIATDSLTPIFDGFIKDLDEVRIAVVEHLSQFLQLILPSKRIAYFPKLAAFLQTDNESNWRFRETFAKQLVLMIPLFKPVKAATHFPGFAEKILCDKVAAVRQMGLLLLTHLVEYISSDHGKTTRLLVSFAEKFALSKKWQKRQTYALFCQHLFSSNALSPEVFASEMLPHLLDLSWDPVPNIRLVVAKTISNYIITNEYFYNPNNSHYDGLQTVLKRLQVDKDRDVRSSAVFSNVSLSGTS